MPSVSKYIVSGTVFPMCRGMTQVVDKSMEILLARNVCYHLFNLSLPLKQLDCRQRLYQLGIIFESSQKVPLLYLNCAGLLHLMLFIRLSEVVKVIWETKIIKCNTVVVATCVLQIIGEKNPFSKTTL